MRTRIIYIVALYLILSLAFSCARPLPTEIKLTTITSNESILNILEKRKANFKDLRAQVSLSFQSVDENYSFHEVLLMQAPTRIRMEILSPFGNPLIFIVTDENNLSIFNIKEKKFYQGEPTQENISRLVGLPVRPQELINLLSGNLPQFTIDSSMKIMFLPDQKMYLLEALNLDYPGKWRIWLEPQDFIPVRTTFISLYGNLIYEVHYKAFQWINDYFFPIDLTILIPIEEKKLDFQYKTLTINQGIAETAFRLEAPGGVDVKALR